MVQRRPMSRRTLLKEAGRMVLVAGLVLAAGRSTADTPPSTDPLIPFSTLLGGSGGELSCTAAMGPDGALWIAAGSSSLDIPGAERSAIEPYPRDIVVLRFDPEDHRILSHLWMGASGEPVALDFDSAGNAFLAGVSYDVDFPASPGFPLSRDPGGSLDSFIARISPDGEEVVWSGSLGGSDDDRVTDLAVTQEGDPVLIGSTSSQDFPMASPLQPVLYGNLADGFVTRIRGDGSGVIFSTFLGGEGNDGARAVDVLPDGRLLVAGNSDSPSFPAADLIFGDTDQPRSSIAILDPGGERVERVAFLGESEISGCVVESSDRVLLWGRTWATDFPAPFPEGRPYAAILLRLDPDDWSVLGASATDVDAPTHCSLAGDGTIWMTAFGGPIPGAARPFPGLDWDSYVAAFSGEDLGQIYGTYLAGSGAEFPGGLVPVADGSAWVVGITESLDFPLVDPIQTGPPDGSEWFDLLFVSHLLAGDPATRPADPMGLAAQRLENGSVRLTWEDEASNETGFAVYRHGRDSFKSLGYETNGVDRIAVIPADSKDWVDTSVVSNRQYAWSVQAINASGGSAPSNVAEVDLPPTLAATVDEGTYDRRRARGRHAFRIRGTLAATGDSLDGALDPRAGGFEWAVPGGSYWGVRFAIPPDDPGWKGAGRRIRWKSREWRIEFEPDTGGFELRLHARYPPVGREGGPQAMQFTLGRRSGIAVAEWRPVGRWRYPGEAAVLRIP